MSSESVDPWEARVQALARAFPYPPTPTVGVRQRARGTASRRLARPALVALAAALVLALLVVPQARAALWSLLQVGGVRIWTEAPPPALSVTPPGAALGLSGPSTLAEARRVADFPIRLPALPVGIGEPDEVFVQQLGGPVVVLIWHGDTTHPPLALHILGEGAFVGKVRPPVVRETTVHGAPALWTTGPYLLEYRDASGTALREQRLVEGHVLVWAEGPLTYRLESGDLPMEEAVRIAESLRE